MTSPRSRTSKSRSMPKTASVADLTEKANGKRRCDQGDIMKSMSESLSYEGKIYGEPFYGESSFTMYARRTSSRPRA